jgi:hypothetical protein
MARATLEKMCPFIIVSRIGASEAGPLPNPLRDPEYVLFFGRPR